MPEQTTLTGTLREQLRQAAAAAIQSRVEHGLLGHAPRG
jgi:hypothetical protein